MAITFDAAGIAAQRAVCEGATKGKWYGSEYGTVNTFTDAEVCVCHSGYDIDFIAMAHEAWPAALTEIERLQPFEAEAAALRKQLASMTRERDAAVSGAAYAKCATCKKGWGANTPRCYPDDDCDICDDWDWRGPCAANAPEGAESEGDK